MDGYAIRVVECGRGPGFPRGALFGGVQDSTPVPVPFGYIVLRGGGRAAVIDTGYRVDGSGGEHASRRGLVGYRSPAELLPPVGIQPEKVDTVLLTHAHWDHAGNLAAFPNAEIVLQTRELRDWLRLAALPRRFATLLEAIDGNDLGTLSDALRLGRLRLVDGDVGDILPGIDILASHDTHTSGHACIVVRNPDGTWVAAGDCVMTIENLAGIDGSGVYAPIANLQGSVVRLLELYDRLLALVDGDASHVLAVHDEGTFRGRFPVVTVAGGARVAVVANDAPAPGGAGASCPDA